MASLYIFNLSILLITSVINITYSYIVGGGFARLFLLVRDTIVTFVIANSASSTA